jgi:hypothetical protein
VLKTTPASSTVFHYDSEGKLIAESSDGTATEYVWLDDVPVAALK